MGILPWSSPILKERRSERLGRSRDAASVASQINQLAAKYRGKSASESSGGGSGLFANLRKGKVRWVSSLSSALRSKTKPVIILLDDGGEAAEALENALADKDLYSSMKKVSSVKHKIEDDCSTCKKLGDDVALVALNPKADDPYAEPLGRVTDAEEVKAFLEEALQKFKDGK